VSAVTLCQTSPSRILAESALPLSNQIDSSLQGPVTQKNDSSPTETATPANDWPETTGSAGGSTVRRFSSA
jgi:hypothetical protein